MADFNEIKNMVRKGIVHSVDKEKMKARVKFPDKGNIISGDLYILIHSHEVKNDITGTIYNTSLSYDVNDELTTEEHTHDLKINEVKIEYWVPKINDMVLCLMIPDGDGEGYILGGIM